MAWVKGAAIGRGNSGEVHLGFRRGFSPEIVAVKSTPLISAANLRREEAILADLQPCPQIISCYGHDITSNSNYNLFLEYADGGSISGPLPELTVRRHLRSILIGLNHIHSKGYVHCDIKPANILVSGGEAKIADFGLCKRSSEKGVGEIRGTPMYMSPETAAGKACDAAADIWAVGCTAAEMVTGKKPWRGFDEGKENGIWGMMLLIGFGETVPEIPSELSEMGKDFLRRCLVREASERWSAAMLLSHPFIDFVMETECGEWSVLEKSPNSVLSYYSFSSDFVKEELGDGNGEEAGARARIGELAGGRRAEWWRKSAEKEGWVVVRERDEDDEGDKVCCFAAAGEAAERGVSGCSVF